LVLLIAAVLQKWTQRSPGQHSSVRILSIAVLPLENLSSDPSQGYFSDGMTDGLITDLAQIPSLKVISRTSSMQYKQTKKSLPDIARELSVDDIVEGTVQRSGDRVRITAQLIEASTDHHLWAGTYEREIVDMFSLEKEVAGDIANQVLVNVTAQNQRASAQSTSVNSQALEEYLQGNYHFQQFSRGSGDEELKIAADHFQRATEIDPNFGLAYVGLADVHSVTLQSSMNDLQTAKEAVQKALHIDPSLSQGWATLGNITAAAWDWAEAEKDLRRAIALNPSNAQARDGLGDLLDNIGKLDEGWKEYQTAQELDPNEDHLEFALYKRHEYDRAIHVVIRALGRDPNNGYLHHQLYELYISKRMYKEAIEQLQLAVTLFGFPDLAASLRHQYGGSGYNGAIREYVRQLEHLHSTHDVFMPVNMAAAYASMGDKDRAFYWLEEGYRRRGYQSGGVDFREIGVYPGLDPLHSDPRFINLLQRMGLPEVRIDESRQASGTGNKALLTQ
jgi:TolB-like protein